MSRKIPATLVAIEQDQKSAVDIAERLGLGAFATPRMQELLEALVPLLNRPRREHAEREMADLIREAAWNLDRAAIKVAEAAYAAGRLRSVNRSQKVGGEKAAERHKPTRDEILRLGDALLMGRRTFSTGELADAILDQWSCGPRPAKSTVMETLRNSREDLKHRANLKIKGKG